MTDRSRLRKLIDRFLDGQLDAIVAERRPYYSWSAIAREVSRRSEIDVSDETLRRWYDTDESTSAEVAA